MHNFFTRPLNCVEIILKNLNFFKRNKNKIKFAFIYLLIFPIQFPGLGEILN